MTRPDPAKIADPVTRHTETQFHLCSDIHDIIGYHPRQFTLNCLCLC